MVRAGPDRVVLIGMMGCGKSTVGSILAERLGWPFHDNDAVLRQLFAAFQKARSSADPRA